MAALKIKEIKVGIVSGPSGAGKGTASRGLIEKYGSRIKLSISWTTRNPRAGEVEGVHYHFATAEEFMKRAQAGGFIEFKEVHRNIYGSPLLSDEELSDAELLLYDIDVQGAEVILKELPQSRLLFFDTKDEELIRRMHERDSGIKNLEIYERLSTAESEREWAVASVRDHRPRFCFLDNSAYSPELCLSVAEAYFLH